MPKIYKEINVYDAAIERYETIFQEFNNYYISVSGGKDSSIMLQLAAQTARRMGKKFSVIFIDLEAQYQATVEHLDELINDTKDVVDVWYWIALPISLRNAVSALRPKWTCWDKEMKSVWVRPMPERDDICLITEDNYPPEWTWFRPEMEFEEFILWFAKWYSDSHKGLTAAGIGIRSDESLNRFRTIVSSTKERYKQYSWTTRVRITYHPTNCWNFYPIYDWTTEDVWTAVSKYNLKYNGIYELLYKNGMSISEQRLCQPYGDDQRKGLDQYRFLEPETWEKVLYRVEGVNFGNIYCRSSLLGNLNSEKPKDMTWQQYAVFLLESLGLYAPEVRDHYYRKIRKFLDWWKKKADLDIEHIPEDKWVLEGYRQTPYWKRIARAVEKNDFWMSTLSFSETKSDVRMLHELKKKYSGLIRADIITTDKRLRELAVQLDSSST